MGVEEYHVENERRVNSLVIEVATLRETLRHSRESSDEIKKDISDLKRGQADGQVLLQKIVNNNDVQAATLKFNIDAQIAPALAPIKAELAALREESVIRKTQLAMLITFGIAVGNVVVYLIKITFGG